LGSAGSARGRSPRRFRIRMTRPLRSPWRATWIALVALPLACVTAETEPLASLAGPWRTYRKLPEQRAMAVAGDPRRSARWVVGMAGGSDTRSGAAQKALEECRDRRRKR